jgi:hypothetical protein
VPELLGTTENELGLRKWIESHGHTLVTTSDKEGANSKFDKELVDAEIIITTPYDYLDEGDPFCKSLADHTLASILDISRQNVLPKPKSSSLPSPPASDLTTSTSTLPTRQMEESPLQK